jgi:hypothetical protein
MTSYIKYSTVILIISSLIACQSSKNEKEEETASKNTISLNEAQQKASKIELGNIEIQTFEKEIELKGKVALNPNSTVSVALPTSGIVKNIYVKITIRI